MPHNALKLLAEASDCGVRITNLEGWTQIRLAKALDIRREMLNAIINQAAGEPVPERPRLLEACQKLIAFAAALSAKDDAVLKLPIDAANLQSDDGQAYEHHRLRLHRLVEQAVQDNNYTDALCRLGEFASSALHAAPKFRLRMLCNLATAIQRLLDKPGSRDVAAPVLRNNLSRMYRALRAARTSARPFLADPAVREQHEYLVGQVGYALVFSGMLLAKPRLVDRGGRRLFDAARKQADPSYGHWSNLLRATNDLLANSPTEGREWAARLLPLVEGEPARAGFVEAYLSLESKNEIQRLREHWDKSAAARQRVRHLLDSDGGGSAARSAGRKLRATASAIAVILTLAGLLTSSARAGDGRDFSRSPQPPAPRSSAAQSTAVPRPERAARSRPAAGMATENGDGAAVRPDGRGRAAAAATPAPATADEPAEGSSGTPTVAAANADPAVAPRRPGRFGGHADFRDPRHSRSVARRGLEAQPVGDPEADAIPAAAARFAASDDAEASSDVRPPQAAWGDVINSYPRAAVSPVVLLPPPPVVAAAPRQAPTDPTSRSTRELEMARNYLAVDRADTARQKLEKLVESYPDSPAARDARALLRELSTP